MNSVAKGVYPTMITPFTADNEVDLDAVERITKWYQQADCEGIFAVCQSSEMFFLSLEEKIAIARRVIQTVRDSGKPTCVVCSGHTSDTLEDQARELIAMHECGAAAVVWVSNRLDINNEGDDVWIANAEKLLSMLPADMVLGIYECPYPYKRLLTPRILEWCKQVGRFAFIKDTCCDPQMLSDRLEQLKDSDIGLFNANSQTLLYTMQRGGAGFSGILANTCPDLFVWLCRHWEDHPDEARRLQELITVCSFSCYPYPVSAKYTMNLAGLDFDLHTRSADKNAFTAYNRMCIDDMYFLTQRAKAALSE